MGDAVVAPRLHGLGLARHQAPDPVTEDPALERRGQGFGVGAERARVSIGGRRPVSRRGTARAPAARAARRRAAPRRRARRARPASGRDTCRPPRPCPTRGRRGRGGRSGRRRRGRAPSSGPGCARPPRTRRDHVQRLGLPLAGQRRAGERVLEELVDMALGELGEVRPRVRQAVERRVRAVVVVAAVGDGAPSGRAADGGRKTGLSVTGRARTPPRLRVGLRLARPAEHAREHAVADGRLMAGARARRRQQRGERRQRRALGASPHSAPRSGSYASVGARIASAESANVRSASSSRPRPASAASATAPRRRVSR